jgi:hypothetical protein
LGNRVSSLRSESLTAGSTLRQERPAPIAESYIIVLTQLECQVLVYKQIAAGALRGSAPPGIPSTRDRPKSP